MSKLFQTAALVLFWPGALIYGVAAMAVGVPLATAANVLNIWSE